MHSHANKEEEHRREALFDALQGAAAASPTIDEIFARYYDSDEEKKQTFGQEFKLFADQEAIDEYERQGRLGATRSLVQK